MMFYQTPVVIKRHPTVYRQTGFTLLELMIVVAIAGIVMAIGVPSFQSITTNNRIAANTNEFITALNLARSEAVKRAAAVSVCKSADGATCTTSGDWDQGWIVYFIDEDDKMVVLRVFDGLAGDDELTSSVNSITYTALGSLDGGNAVEFNFKLCRKGFSEGRNKVEINSVGRASSTRVSCD